MVRRDELRDMVGLCARYDAALIVDEVFADYAWSTDVPGGTGRALDQSEALAFSLGGLSKTVGLPQVKLGWMALGGPDAAVDGALARLELAADTYLSVSTPVQLSAAELLARGASVRREIQSRVATNRESLAERAARTPSCQVLAGDGGWYAVVQVPSYESEEDLVVGLLEEDGVLAHPGYFFDFPRESFLVVSLIAPPDQFGEGIGRILRRFDGASEPR
jgi:aspartate/methionine/tyrosine aminotransferase